MGILHTQQPYIMNSIINIDCDTLRCENASICEKAAQCEKISTLNAKIDAICQKITLNVKKIGSLNV